MGVIPAVDAKLISVSVVFAWNYLTARLWVFNVMEPPKDKKGLMVFLT